MKLPLIETGTNKVYLANIMEDNSFEIETLNLGVNDPCFAIFRFQHGAAPSPNVATCEDLLIWYDTLCETDDFDMDTPGERMIGKQFNVLCWKSTELESVKNAKAGVTYAAEIVDCHGFGTDGFFIEELGMTVDTAVFALKHFIVA